MKIVGLNLCLGVHKHLLMWAVCLVVWVYLHLSKSSKDYTSGATLFLANVLGAGTIFVACTLFCLKQCNFNPLYLLLL